MLSYHSLEDRPVKQAFQRLAQEGTLKILTKKVIQASDAEIAANPRARSVKMRVAEKTDAGSAIARNDSGEEWIPKEKYPDQHGMPQEEE